jgi:hypothetical protein
VKAARVTAFTVRALELELGASLRVVEVTQVNDRERMFLILTPRCPYCGQLNPRRQCRSCGASARIH